MEGNMPMLTRRLLCNHTPDISRYTWNSTPTNRNSCVNSAGTSASTPSSRTLFSLVDQRRIEVGQCSATKLTGLGGGGAGTV
jgi:hypothetical protein